MTILNLLKMAESSPKGEKTLWEKEKLLISNFSFFHIVFIRLVLQAHKNQGLFGKGLTLYSTDTHFDALTLDSFWKQWGKEEIAHKKQFLLFPQCFLLNQIIVSPFVHIFDILSLLAAELEDPKLA